MKKSDFIKQSKPHPRLGGFQVQMSVTMSHYVVYINLSFMGMMFWHTTAAPYIRQFYAGAEFWQFAVFMLLIISSIMLFDMKYVYPSRQAFISHQSYKHDNPAVRDLKILIANDKQQKSDLDKIKKKLGIEDENT